MTMTSTTSEKVKEIAVKSLSYFLNHDYYDHDESFDVWAATEEGSRLVGELVEGWVSVMVRMPQTGVEVIGYFPDKTEGGKTVAMAINYNGEELQSAFPNSTAYAFIATHWKPLPPPPKPMQEGEGESYASMYFHNHRQTFTGIQAGEYLDKEDFEKFVATLPHLSESPIPSGEQDGEGSETQYELWEELADIVNYGNENDFVLSDKISELKRKFTIQKIV